MTGRCWGKAALRSPFTTSIAARVCDGLLRDGQEVASTPKLCRHRRLIYSNKINSSAVQKKKKNAQLHPSLPSAGLSPANGRQQLCLEKKTDVFMGPMNLTGKPTTPGGQL